MKKTSNHGSHNLEKVLNFSTRLEESLNSFEVLGKYLISLLGLEKSFKYATSFSEKLNYFANENLAIYD